MISNIQALWIPGPLPGLNEIIDAKRRRLRNNAADGYSRLKAQWMQRIVLAVRTAKLKPVAAARLEYELHEPNRRRDPSNVAAGAIKLLEDGLVKAGILPGDGWRHIVSFSVSWCVSDEPGVMVGIESARPVLGEKPVKVKKPGKRRRRDQGVAVNGGLT